MDGRIRRHRVDVRLHRAEALLAVPRGEATSGVDIGSDELAIRPAADPIVVRVALNGDLLTAVRAMRGNEGAAVSDDAPLLRRRRARLEVSAEGSLMRLRPAFRKNVFGSLARHIALVSRDRRGRLAISLEVPGAAKAIVREGRKAERRIIMRTNLSSWRDPRVPGVARGRVRIAAVVDQRTPGRWHGSRSSKLCLLMMPAERLCVHSAPCPAQAAGLLVGRECASKGSDLDPVPGHMAGVARDSAGDVVAHGMAQCVADLVLAERHSPGNPKRNALRGRGRITACCDGKAAVVGPKGP
mmetsp:Transcript_28058/g.81311  ORF Transcript_28058/g.81311 Transcript_28058/m.81311 type:complete len:299 (+) Transcript_28058:226-1122(+)